MAEVRANGIDGEQAMLIAKPRAPKVDIVESILSRIGTGKYQYLCFFILGIGILADAAEVIAMSILNYVFTEVVWFRSLDDLQLMGVCIFISVSAGNLCSGFLSDKYGRKKTFTCSTLAIFCSGILSVFASSFTSFIISRVIFGFFAGILYPVSACFIAEINEKTARAKYWLLNNLWWVIGELFGIGVGHALEVDKKGNNTWKPMIIWTCIPAFIAAVVCWNWLLETPRFALLNNPDQGIQILDKMHECNKKAKLHLTSQEVRELEDWSDKRRRVKGKAPIKELFTSENLRNTICLIIVWFSLTLGYYGVMYMIPLASAALKLESSPQETGIHYWDLLIPTFFELPALLVVNLVIENKRFGRRNTMIFSLLFASLSCLLGHIVSSQFVVFMSISRFFLQAAFCIVYLLTAELFKTSCRGTAIGFIAGVSRVGGYIMPWMGIALYEKDPTLPFVVFSLFLLVAAVALWVIDHDTVGSDLDTFEDDEDDHENLHK